MAVSIGNIMVHHRFGYSIFRFESISCEIRGSMQQTRAFSDNLREGGDGWNGWNGWKSTVSSPYAKGKLGFRIASYIYIDMYVCNVIKCKCKCKCKCNVI